MKKFDKRLRQIERSFQFDSSGYAPGSEAWQNYWDGEMDKSIAGEPSEKLPLEAFRSWMQRGGNDERSER
jgi:hypothetical protein